MSRAIPLVAFFFCLLAASAIVRVVQRYFEIEERYNLLVGKFLNHECGVSTI